MHSVNAVHHGLGSDALFNESKMDNMLFLSFLLRLIILLLPDLLIEPIFLNQEHALGRIINDPASLLDDGPFHVVNHLL